VKEDLRRIVTDASPTVRGFNLAREYLQSRILGIMQEAGAMMPLAFCGGTALRFLYGLQRFSEDIDFSLVRVSDHFSLTGYVDKITQTLAREGYTIIPRWRNPERAVQSVMLRFPGLPMELGLSRRAEQNLSIRLDVDINPPAGAGTDISIVRRFQLLRLQHRDKSSLFAGKIHAVLVREFTKGRDFYDLAWYLGSNDWPAPNLEMLRNALVQAGWTRERVDSMNLREELLNRFDSVDWQAVHRDILPFLERPEEVNLLNSDDMNRLLDQMK
jgi:predicted nucleotidyltransferase component of viral defense system